LSNGRGQALSHPLHRDVSGGPGDAGLREKRDRSAGNINRLSVEAERRTRAKILAALALATEQGEAVSSHRRVLPAPLNWLGAGLGFLVRVALITWATLAIFYSNLPWPALRLGLALGFAGFSIWALWLSRQRWPQLALAVGFLGVVVWWITIQPSINHHWRPEVAVMPRAFIDGDLIRISGVRDFEYRSLDDFTVRYQEREMRLSHLTALDFYVSHWSDGLIGRLVGHTFLSFDFDDAPPLSISIEIRPKVGQGFDPLASLFKQYELIYVVGDERDLVRVRTNFRGEAVYLYHLNTSAQIARRLFRIYLMRINELADRPEFYNLLSNNCTLNIVRYANAAGREGRFDIRHLFNGLIDSYLYYSGRVDTTLPFAEFRRRSRINEAAEAADNAPDFAQRIRQSLPTFGDQLTP
jgi:hypothetical protein